MRKTSDATRPGLTILEVLVVLVVIAILMALLLPAIQGTRAAARRLSCQSHLRQVGLAIGNYESSYGVFPNGGTLKYDLLPYLDLKSLHAKRLPPAPGRMDAYLELMSTVVAVYQCPAESEPALLDGVAGSSYAACYGSGLTEHGFNGMFANWMGMYSDRYPSGPVRFADVIRGASNVVMVSEILHGSGQPQRLRTRWNTPDAYGTAAEQDAFRKVCEGLPPQPDQVGWRGNSWDRGRPWFDGNFGSGQYNHMLPPNRPSCLNQTSLPYGIHTANSLHSGGVNVLYVDGRVEFVGESIDRKVWSDLGARADTVFASGFVP